MKVITLSSWIDYTKLIHEEFNENHWIFRGHSDHEWLLIPSLQRLKRSDAIEIERELLRRYKSYLTLKNIAPLPEDALSCLAHMQHHGCPTRLLDFTKSPYIAAFFAYEDTPKFIKFKETEYIAIWAINSSWLRSETISRLLNYNEFLTKLIEDGIDYEATKLKKQTLLDLGDEQKAAELEKRFCEILEEKIRSYFGDFFIDSNHKVNIIFPVEPRTLSQRFYDQQGIFLSSSNISEGFMENLKSYPKYDDNVCLVLLPKSERENALKHFYKHNVTRAYLFGGVDGFAQSLLNSIQLPEEMNVSRANTLLTK